MTTQQQPRKALLLSSSQDSKFIINKSKGYLLGVTILFLIYFFAIAAPELET